MRNRSITGLLRETRDQNRLFLRQEWALAKAEVFEKVRHYRVGITLLGVGAFLAYAALLVLLGCLGQLLSFLLQSIGMDLIPSRSAGFGGVGLLVIVLGGVVAFKGLKSLSKQSVSPEKTLYTIARIKGEAPKKLISRPSSPRRKSKDVQADIFEIQERLGGNAHDLVQRLSPARYLGIVVRRAQAHPVRWNLGALVAGFAGSVWFVKRLKR